MAVKLSEAELIALRDEAKDEILQQAGERLRWYDPDRCEGGDPDEARLRATERMMGAAEVYGACKNAARGFGGPTEWVKVEFTERAQAWLIKERESFRSMLEAQRRSIEVDEHTHGDTFLLFVLDGIFEGEQGEAS